METLKRKSGQKEKRSQEEKDLLEEPLQWVKLEDVLGCVETLKWASGCSRVVVLWKVEKSESRRLLAGTVACSDVALFSPVPMLHINYLGYQFHESMGMAHHNGRYPGSRLGTSCCVISRCIILTWPAQYVVYTLLRDTRTGHPSTPPSTPP